MSFEDQLRHALQRADETLPTGPPVTWYGTMARVRQGRLLSVAAAVAAATVVIVAGAWVAGTLPGGEQRRFGPVGTTPTDSPSPSPEPEPTPTPPPDPCSAAGLPAAAQEGLPDPIADMRAAVLDAARRCDYQALEDLALAGEPGFSYSFGEDGDPGGYWRRYEEGRFRDEDIMARLVQTLGLMHCREEVSDGTSYIFWPSVMCADADDADWEALEQSGLYSNDELRSYREQGFLGYRVGISESGDWIVFVAGD
jgi:hypothetical protein